MQLGQYHVYSFAIVYILDFYIIYSLYLHCFQLHTATAAQLFPPGKIKFYLISSNIPLSLTAS